MAFSGKKVFEEAGEYIHVFMDPPPPKQDEPIAKYTNRFVEAARASPYWVGHVDQFVWPLFWILVIKEAVQALP